MVAPYREPKQKERESQWYDIAKKLFTKELEHHFIVVDPEYYPIYTHAGDAILIFLSKSVAIQYAKDHEIPAFIVLGMCDEKWEEFQRREKQWVIVEKKQ